MIKQNLSTRGRVAFGVSLAVVAFATIGNAVETTPKRPAAFKTPAFEFVRGTVIDPAESGTIDLASESPTTFNHCELFEDGVQETKPARVSAPTKISVTLEVCKQKNGTQERIATRNIKAKGDKYLLLVEPFKLKTTIEKASCWVCEPSTHEKLKGTRFMAAVDEFTHVKPKGKSKALVGVGLKHSESGWGGSILTADLCPSLKPLERHFIEHLIKSSAQHPVPIAFSMTGGWMKHHQADFDWLKKKVSEGLLDITWIDHSFTHPFKTDTPDEENFLRTPGINMESEILLTEKMLIDNGVTPSIFFRFPGLISDGPLTKAVADHSLITIDSDAWLAKDQNPSSGSVVLIHANGNEQRGLSRFFKLWDESKIPMPLEPVSSAPHR